MSASCILCGGGEHAPSTLGHGLVQCRACALIFLPTASEWADEFGSSYYIGGAYVDYVADRAAISRTAAARLTRIEAMTRSRRLLDVGCAAGYFLDAARRRGWDVTGLELSTFAAQHAQDLHLPVHVASISNPPVLAPFDVVTMWDTIEHIARPDLALRNVHRLLNPQGIVVLSTGDCRSLFARACGRQWRLLADPTHKFFFDRTTLTQLVERAGFRVIAAAHPGKWVSAAMGLHQLPGKSGRLLKRITARARFNPTLYVNLGDVITMTAVKAD